MSLEHPNSVNFDVVGLALIDYFILCGFLINDSTNIFVYR
uniref:Hypotheticial protein n=1 Tax=Schistosoma japonicum TaxID=6182 RepID=C7TYM9_SCHJA|nr:hypotheticial protein [Schistosoma japonicum]